MSFINHTDENWMFVKGKKRNFIAMDESAEMLSPVNSNKRLKMSKGSEVASNVEMERNEQKVFGNKNESTDAKTRTHCRRKLTAENLKTILRYVLANNSVLAMVQNTMKSQKENKSQMKIESQPKSTESKAKEFPMSHCPASTPKTPDVSKKLLEEEYSEESASDEDYQPNEEELSDEDAASSVKADDLNSSKVEDYISPDLKPPDQPSDDEDALVIALPETDVCHDKEVDKIAQRTRSKICLNDTPLEDIELSFQPPDITMDMYDTDCDNADWKEFICEFTKPLNETSGVGSVADDTEDEKDPEYKVQVEEEEEEEEDEEIDYEEIFGENPLEVSRDEVNDLMSEILEFAQQDKILLEQDFSFLEELSLTFSGNDKNENDSEKEKTKNAPQEENENNSSVEHSSNDLETDMIAKNSITQENTNNLQELQVTEIHTENALDSTEKAPLSPVHVDVVRKEWIIPDERRQLDEQLRMYVQLLTQSYLLSHGFPNLHFINVSSRDFLNEIKLLASIGTRNNHLSAFYAHNLDDAIDVVNKFETQAELKKRKSNKLNKRIPDNIRKVLATSKAFIYPELLPKNAFYTFFLGSKASFSTAEDNLIALGLEQFSYMEDPILGIKEFLLPTKSTYQIRCRIKNCKQKKESENAITYFCKHKKLAEFHRVIRVFDPNNVKAPEEYPPSALPAWMESYSKVGCRAKNAEKLKSYQEKRHKLILPRIQVVPLLIQEINPQEPQDPPKPMICKVYSVNENKLSKGGSGLMLPKRINRQRKRLAKNQVNKSTQCPESSDILIDSCISQSIKQEPLSDETSDEESVEDDNNSDSSSEYTLNLRHPLHKKNYALRKRKSTNTNEETCQTDSSFCDTQTFHPVLSIKEESLSSEISNEECLENNSEAHASHSETNKSRTLDNSSHRKLNQMQVEYSTLTEPSLRIVTSQGDESSDSEQSIAECSELLAPIRKFQCSIIEDAVLPPALNSGEKHLPSDFSTIRDIICSEEKRNKLLDSDKTKVKPKKACKSKRTWSMAEDQLIISNCQRYGINKRAFRASADEIGALTPLKVKTRFIYLLKLLSEKLKDTKDNH